MPKIKVESGFHGTPFEVIQGYPLQMKSFYVVYFLRFLVLWLYWPVMSHDVLVLMIILAGAGHI